MSTPFWDRARHEDRRPFLHRRQAVTSALRGWFTQEGFTEVECGHIQRSPGNEAHLHGFPVSWRPEDGAPAILYLHTSPEFACKKLLAAGETKIVDFARVFRNGEVGPLHSPEFTMVEWYRVAASYDAVMDDSVALARAAAAACKAPALSWRGATCDPFAEPERLSLSEAFDRYAGIDLAAVLGDRDAFAGVALAKGIPAQPDDQWSDLFSRVVVTKIEPRLGLGRITLLDAYPLAEAALARPQPHDRRFAERFEMYACGVELANGFGELTDADEQRRRFTTEMDVKEATYGRRYPLDEDFLAALAHMPDASGVALGLDRLVMLAAGARHINDVLWTPFPVDPS